MRPGLVALAAVAAFVAVLPLAARAGSFYVVSRTAAAWTILDPAAVETLPGGLRRVSSVTVQKSITPRGPPQPGYLRSLSEYDCAQRATRWLRFTLYLRSGSVVMTQQNPKPAWTRPSRGAEGDRALALLCGEPGGADLPVISAPTVGDLVLGLMAAWS